ncbi:armadillo-type protein [Paraphysoderma sedebokerense]|nr:armadillo-type protein [Paraphysoderma sedebokerense]
MPNIDLNSLLVWSIENAGKDEDAPPRPANEEAPKPKPIDPKWIDIILGKPDSVRMKDCMAEIQDTSLQLEVREQAFDELELLVEQIDNASNMKVLKLWQPLIECTKYSEPSLRRFAVWVMGTCVQNNPEAQKQFIEARGIQTLIDLLKNENDDSVLSKVVYAVSGLLTHNPGALHDFNSHNGLHLLSKSLVNPQSKNNMKIVFLLYNLINQYKEIANLFSEGNGNVLITILKCCMERTRAEDGGSGQDWDLWEKVTLSFLPQTICHDHILILSFQ